MTQRILRSVPATIEAWFVDQHGVAVEPVDAVSVDVRRANGIQLTSGSATKDPTDTGRVTFKLTATDTALLDELNATWTDAEGRVAESHIAIVGAFLFTIREARMADEALADPGRYSDAAIVAARNVVEAEAELIMGRSFVPRYARGVMDGDGTGVLQLPHRDIRSIRSLSVCGTVWTDPQLTALVVDPLGLMQYPYGGFLRGLGSVVVEYEYGVHPAPEDLKRRAIQHLRHSINAARSSIPDRATSYSIAEAGVFSLATPGRDGWETGIPDVDATYKRYARQVPVIA